MRTSHTLSVVQDTEHLMELCDDGASEFSIALNGGVRSSKNVSWNGKRFFVYNEIDGSLDRLTPQQFEESFIGEALKAHALYVLG